MPFEPKCLNNELEANNENNFQSRIYVTNVTASWAVKTLFSLNHCWRYLTRDTLTQEIYVFKNGKKLTVLKTIQFALNSLNLYKIR